MMIDRLLLAALFLIFSIFGADAASRFWNPLIVSGAVDNGSGLCRLTISPAITGSGLITGTGVITTGITGATGCNVTTTVTVISSTQIDLVGTTFGGVYVNGGCVAGGNLTATNTSNWASSSTATCGSGGQTVPGSGDTVTLDANSLGGTITLNFGGTFSITSLTMGAFGGTFDNSVNNNNITAGGSITWSGTGTRTIKLGTATYTATTGAATMGADTVNNLTYTGNSGASFVFSGANAIRKFDMGSSGSFAHGNVTFAASTGTGYVQITSLTSTNTLKSLTINGPNYVGQVSNAVITVTPNALTFNGSASGLIVVQPVDSAITSVEFVPGAGSSAIWTAFRGVVSTGLVATNSFAFGNATGITITAPATGGSGGTIIGGGL